MKDRRLNARWIKTGRWVSPVFIEVFMEEGGAALAGNRETAGPYLVIESNMLNDIQKISNKKA